MKKLILFPMFSLTLLLTSCAPAVLVAGAAGATIGGAVIYDKRSYSTMTQDQNARAIAQKRLDDSEVLKDHSHISISVFNRVGLLVGQAQTAEIREEAARLVKDTPGIQQLYNEIVVGPATTHGQRAKDTWITTKVRTVMLGTSGLQSTNLKVVTEDGVVYLMGVVTHQQGDLATEVARKISNVKKVVAVFIYE